MATPTPPSKLFLYYYTTDLSQCYACKLTIIHPQTRLVMCYQASRDKSLPSQPQHLIVSLPYATGKYLLRLMGPAISKESFKSTKARHYLICLAMESSKIFASFPWP